jgi:hypothetical protein
MNDLYTFLFEYKSQKYLSQVTGANPYDAIVPWASDLNFDRIKGIGSKTKQMILNEVKSLEQDLLVPIAEVKNIWGFGILSRGYGTIDLIQTETKTDKQENVLFSFVLDYQGGTYISQVKAKSLDAAKVQWAKKIGSQSIANWNEKEKKQLFTDIHDIPLQASTPHINVWTFEIKFGKKIGFVYCIKTKDYPLSQRE